MFYTLSTNILKFTLKSRFKENTAISAYSRSQDGTDLA